MVKYRSLRQVPIHCKMETARLLLPFGSFSLLMTMQITMLEHLSCCYMGMGIIATVITKYEEPKLVPRKVITIKTLAGIGLLPSVENCSRGVPQDLDGHIRYRRSTKDHTMTSHLWLLVHDWHHCKWHESTMKCVRAEAKSSVYVWSTRKDPSWAAFHGLAFEFVGLHWLPYVWIRSQGSYMLPVMVSIMLLQCEGCCKSYQGVKYL